MGIAEATSQADVGAAFLPCSLEFSISRWLCIAPACAVVARREPATWASEQTQIAQFAAQRLGHRRDAGGGLAEIRRRGIVPEITPALERPHRPRRDRDHFRLHHQPAAADAVLVAE